MSFIHDFIIVSLDENVASSTNCGIDNVSTSGLVNFPRDSIKFFVVFKTGLQSSFPEKC
eukprot:SAG31_NODE_943_length_10852_cov_22.874454_9_plen_59_part_00